MIYDTDTIEKIAPTGLLAHNWQVLLQAASSGFNAPFTSGMGRLFDAVAALAGIGRIVDYDGQAAIALEQLLDRTEKGSYDISITAEDDSYLLDWREMLTQILTDINNKTDVGVISARFHRAICNISLDICIRLRDETGINIVALSGGCWQNLFLINKLKSN